MFNIKHKTTTDKKANRAAVMLTLNRSFNTRKLFFDLLKALLLSLYEFFTWNLNWTDYTFLFYKKQNTHLMTDNRQEKLKISNELLDTLLVSMIASPLNNDSQSRSIASMLQLLRRYICAQSGTLLIRISEDEPSLKITREKMECISALLPSMLEIV